MDFYSDSTAEGTTTTGTGPLTLNGVAPLSYRTFAGGGVTNGSSVTFLTTMGYIWEVSRGTFTSPNQLTRTLISSSTGSLINWGAGLKTVSITLESSAINALIAYKEIGHAKTVATMSALLSADTSSTTIVKDYHSDTAGGGGTFIWDAAKNKNLHNGGTIIDPDITFPTDWTNQAQLTTWFDGSANETLGCWIRQYDGAIHAKWFGIKADGITNDSRGLEALGAKITADDGGTIELPEGGTIICGYQVLAGATGLGGSYLESTLLRIDGCTTPVIIRGNGCKFKIADGMRFGSFNPINGAIHNPAMPFYDADYRADATWGVIQLHDNESIHISDIDIDGNLQNYIVGGTWGDTGYQIGGYGVYLYGNNNAIIENVKTNYSGTDGIIIGRSAGAPIVEGDPKIPHLLKNVVSVGNGRQGLSLVGASGFTAINCTFSDTGKTVNIGTGVALSSSPGAGVDLEAEGGSVNRDLVFTNCEMVNNTGSGMVADSGDSARVSFDRCTFIAGVNGTAIWPNKPYISFNNCIIRGDVSNIYGVSNTPENTTFDGCQFSDEDWGALAPFSAPAVGTRMFGSTPTFPTYFRNCSFTNTKVRPGQFTFAVLENCVFDISIPGTAAVANQEELINLAGSSLHNVTINTNISTNLPADAYYLYLDSIKRPSGKNILTNSGAGLVYWQTWSVGAGAYTGELGEYETGISSNVGRKALSLFPNVHWSQYYGTIETYVGAAAPVTGTYKLGDKVYNQAPAAGGFVGWVCVTAGTPGTWKTFGVISA